MDTSGETIDHEEDWYLLMGGHLRWNYDSWGRLILINGWMPEVKLWIMRNVELNETH